MESEDRVKEAREQIWGATKKHRWIGCLVSFHTDFLYRDEDVAGEMLDLLDEQIAWREQTLKELSVPKAALQRSYDWMRWCDRCSLILCGDDVPAMGRHVEIITDSTGRRFDMRCGDDECIQIMPWPFSEQAFELELETRMLNQLSFADDADLAENLMESDVVKRRFQLQADFK